MMIFDIILFFVLTYILFMPHEIPHVPIHLWALGVLVAIIIQIKYDKTMGIMVILCLMAVYLKQKYPKSLQYQ